MEWPLATSDCRKKSIPRCSRGRVGTPQRQGFKMCKHIAAELLPLLAKALVTFPKAESKPACNGKSMEK
jgi:hypothetical protein